MMTVQRLDFCSLDRYRYSRYEAMTADTLRCYLSHKPLLPYPDATTISIGVEDSGEPIAVAHLTFHTSNKIGQIDLFAVKEGVPFQGTADRLLDAIETLVKEKQCGLASFHFTNGSPLASIFERRGWSKPTLFLCRVNFDPPSFTTPWLHRDYPLPEG
jgi:hypothetical protein